YSAPLSHRTTSRSVEARDERVVDNMTSASRTLVLPLAFLPTIRMPDGGISRSRCRYVRNSSSTKRFRYMKRRCPPPLVSADDHGHDHVGIGLSTARANDPRLGWAVESHHHLPVLEHRQHVRQVPAVEG